MIENHLAYHVVDIELGCPDNCPRLQELEEKYVEMMYEWKNERDSWVKNYPGEPFPEELDEPPAFPECDECDYMVSKKEEKEIEKARMLGVD